MARNMFPIAGGLMNSPRKFFNLLRNKCRILREKKNSFFSDNFNIIYDDRISKIRFSRMAKFAYE